MDRAGKEKKARPAGGKTPRAEAHKGDHAAEAAKEGGGHKGGDHHHGGAREHRGRGGHAGHAARPLSEFDFLCRAAEGFLRANANVESSAPVNAAADELVAATAPQAAFEAPLRHRVFGMEAALRWALFWATAPRRVVDEEDEEPFPGEFSEKAALALVAAVYDLGAHDFVWGAYDDESDSEGDEGAGSAGDASPADAADDDDGGEA